MRTNQLFFLSLFLVAGFTSLSCTKEGPVGPPGQDGNANVQSEKINVFSSEWEGDGSVYSVIKESNIITEDIAINGAVLCYLEFDNASYTPLPFSIYSGNWTTHIGFEHSGNEILFFFQDDDGQTPEPGFRTFKVVAIESRGLAENPGLNLEDYEAVKRAFNLAD